MYKSEVLEIEFRTPEIVKHNFQIEVSDIQTSLRVRKNRKSPVKMAS